MSKIKKQAYRAAYIEWEDICRMGGVWTDVEKIENDPTTMLFHTVAWVIKKTDKHLHLVMHYDQEDVKAVSSIWQIPMTNVKKIKYIKL